MMNQPTEDKFIVTSGERKASFVMMGVGLLALITGIVLAISGVDHWGTKVWTGILTNNMFFLGLALAALFFVTAHYLALGGYHVVIKRVPEAMSMFLPVAAVLMIPVMIGLWTHSHHIYHWADPDAVASDEILQGKAAYLNIPFFTIRAILYFGLWIVFAYLMRKVSLAEDKMGGLVNYKKSKIYSALFIIVFAVTSSTMAWDFLMSIDAHWYSTLYGWYAFSSYLVAALAAMVLIVLYLKSRGFLPKVNNEHLHDMGKWVFAFSVFWTYLWFSQYMLIWYGNLGEETAYFKARLDHYPFLFYLILIINFGVPFLALMTRNNKRKIPALVIVSVLVLAGHWLDFFLMVVPGASGNSVHFGLFEIGMTVGYLGLFIYVVFGALAKARLTPVNHPFYKESLEHHT